jgi:hypothetical protein
MRNPLVGVFGWVAGGALFGYGAWFIYQLGVGVAVPFAAQFAVAVLLLNAAFSLPVGYAYDREKSRGRHPIDSDAVLSTLRSFALYELALGVCFGALYGLGADKDAIEAAGVPLFFLFVGIYAIRIVALKARDVWRE